MNLEDAVLAVLAGLNRLAVPYMLVGSFSSNTYGIPRATQDADFVVQVEAEGVRRIVEQLGPPFRLEPQVTFETITATTRYAVEVTGTAFTIEFFLLSDDPHDIQRFAPPARSGASRAPRGGHHAYGRGRGHHQTPLVQERQTRQRL